jgi:hypothetical protein
MLPFAKDTVTLLPHLAARSPASVDVVVVVVVLVDVASCDVT